MVEDGDHFGLMLSCYELIHFHFHQVKDVIFLRSSSGYWDSMLVIRRAGGRLAKAEGLRPDVSSGTGRGSGGTGRGHPATEANFLL